MAAAKKIETEDCLFFSNPDPKTSDYLKHIEEFTQKFSTDAVFSFSNKTRNESIDYEQEPFAVYEYDKKEGKFNWRASRWVGEIISKGYTIKVNPRFGNLCLFKMLEEIFSINILSNKVDQNKNNDSIESIMQQFIPFIWEKKLSKANRYGVPRKNVKNYYKGNQIKGHLDVRKSIIPLFKEKQVISFSYEKQIDSTISLIIQQAYKILSKKRKIQLSDDSKNAIDNIKMANIPNKRITDFEYQKIQYKSIYQSYKEVVDFSWQIIKNYNFMNKESDVSEGFSCWIDMAEIWELFLLSILKKSFSDWKVESPKINVYDKTFYSRHIIPDIVLTKDNDVMIFDAKWKKMNFVKDDVDRCDFFQIHTYVSYYQILGKNVKVAGLLYPFKDIQKEQNDSEDILFGINKETKFIIGGISFPEKNDNENVGSYMERFDAQKEIFINNIKKVAELIE